MNKPLVRKLRCAVYTRKSSEEGLEQEFNSLDAQREACEAYIASQRSEGVCGATESRFRPRESVSSGRRGSGARGPRRVLVRTRSRQTLGNKGTNDKAPADVVSEGLVKRKPQTDSSGAS